MWSTATPWASSAPPATTIWQQLNGALPGRNLEHTRVQFNGDLYYGDVNGATQGFGNDEREARQFAFASSVSEPRFSFPRAQRLRYPRNGTVERHRKGAREFELGARYCMRTTRHTLRTSCISAARRLTTATSSTRQQVHYANQSPTARCSSARRTA